MKRHIFRAYMKEIFITPGLYAGIAIVAAIVIFVCTVETRGGFLTTQISLFLGLSAMKTVALLPACLPIISGFCDDCKHQYLRLIVSRSGVRKFTIAKFTAGFISAFLVLAGGITLAMLILSFKFPLSDAPIPGNIYYGYYEFLPMGMPAMIVITLGGIYATYGAFYASVGLLTAAYMPNKFLVFATPFAVGFAFEELSYGFQLPAFISFYNLDVGVKIFEEASLTFNIVYTVAVALVFTVLLYFVFHKIVEKRVRCEID